MDAQTIIRRFPHLIKRLQRVGILSQTEAASAIRAHLLYNDNSACACEAVAHWCAGGSVLPMIQLAIRIRAN